MTISSGRRRAIAFFVTVCVLLCALAVGLNVGWVILTFREALLLLVGLVLFTAIIAGLILNTTFLVREIRRNEQQDAFLNAMTHELKTPLASIRLYLDTLKRHDLDAAKRAEFYDVMREDSDRLLKTIEQVLQAGRVSKSKLLLQKAEVDVNDLVESCVAVARRQHQLTAEQLRVDSSERQLLRVIGDPDELRAAVSNLIDNAVKYSPERVVISVRVRQSDRQEAAIEVSDLGLGIDEPQLKRIFKRFYRIPGSPARIKGTGLGLFIVHSVARKHRGRVFATSPGPGLGSTFTITLPLAESPGVAVSKPIPVSR